MCNNMICQSCKKSNLPKSEFTLSSNPKVVFYKKCKECRAAFAKKWYDKNKEKILDKIAERTKTLKDYVFNLLSDSQCVDCGCKDIRVLEFDHLENKKTDINILINNGASLPLLQSEIEKCEIVCGNCHRIRTDNRIGGSYRTLTYEELVEIKKNRSASKRTKLKKQLKILEIFKCGCMDCRTDDVRVLEFDHVRGEKNKNVSKLLSDNAKWEVIEEEIAKCDVVCRNCHTIRGREIELKTYRIL